MGSELPRSSPSRFFWRRPAHPASQLEELRMCISRRSSPSHCSSVSRYTECAKTTLPAPMITDDVEKGAVMAEEGADDVLMSDGICKKNALRLKKTSGRNDDGDRPRHST